MVHAYKVFTHDLRPPVQGGPPVWDGSLPFMLPPVPVDTSTADCAAGWNACRNLATALRLAGLWPDGRPSRAFAVETDARGVERGDKLRATTWTIHRECREDEIGAAVQVLSQAFGDIAPEMATEQMAWRAALARPLRDRAAVEAGLRAALDARGLHWLLREFPTARAAWVAKDAWGAWTAMDAWASWATWEARGARDARNAWDSRDAKAARVAWDARDARNALTTRYAALRGQTKQRPDLLTVGLRDAYQYGLGLALLIAPDVLGWAMEETR